MQRENGKAMSKSPVRNFESVLSLPFLFFAKWAEQRNEGNIVANYFGNALNSVQPKSDYRWK